MPSLKISSWTWEKVTTERQAHEADTPVLKSATTDVEEKVRAVFAILDVEPFARTSRSKTLVLPEVLVVNLTSTNGRPWKIGWKAVILASNVLKNGELGARVDIDSVWFPDWAKEWTYSHLFDASPVNHWVSDEYPR